MSRYLLLLLCVFATPGFVWLAILGYGSILWIGAAISGALALVGMVDVIQTRQSIRRNYPILSHFRFFFEEIRPEIR